MITSAGSSWTFSFRVGHLLSFGLVKVITKHYERALPLYSQLAGTVNNITPVCQTRKHSLNNKDNYFGHIRPAEPNFYNDIKSLKISWLKTKIICRSLTDIDGHVVISIYNKGTETYEGF